MSQLLSTLVTPDVGVREKIVKGISANSKMTREVSNINLFEGLIRRKVETEKVERSARLVAGFVGRKEELIVDMMKAALEVVKVKEKDSVRDYHRKLSEAVRAIPPGWRRKEFRLINCEEGNRVWEDCKRKNRIKKDHLEKKFKDTNCEIEDEFRGIKISDKGKGENDFEKKVAVYGIEVNEDEKEFLCLPKDFY